MTVNRLADAEIDKANPRTAVRAIPAGLLKKTEALFYTVLSLVIFLIAVFQLAPVTHKVWPLFVVPFMVYPYTKRYTWLCHFWLGLSIGLAPLASWLAVRNVFDWRIILLDMVVLVWIAGFDVIYATQDVDHDKQAGLHSIPARFGISKALKTTRVLHLLAVVFLAALGMAFNLGIWFYLGVIIVAGLLAYENSLVKPDDLSRLNAAFFTMNGIISIVALVFTTLDYI